MANFHFYGKVEYIICTKKLVDLKKKKKIKYAKV